MRIFTSRLSGHRRGAAQHGAIRFLAETPLWQAGPDRALRPARGLEEPLSISGSMRDSPPVVRGAKNRHAEDL
ncbi:MAG TPA: hypothetical protein VFF88_08885 [Methylocella sp.]|nr:hypothetical protein [Methylocella sp.]